MCGELNLHSENDAAAERGSRLFISRLNVPPLLHELFLPPSLPRARSALQIERASCEIPTFGGSSATAADELQPAAKALSVARWKAPKRSTRQTFLPFPRNQYRYTVYSYFPPPRRSSQVEYDFAGSILHVTIVKCEDLAAMDIGGTSDPYVKVYLLPDRKRKQVRNFEEEQEGNSLSDWPRRAIFGSCVN